MGKLTGRGIDLEFYTKWLAELRVGYLHFSLFYGWMGMDGWIIMVGVFSFAF